MTWPTSHGGFPLADAEIQAVKRGDLVAWDDEDLYLVLSVVGLGPDRDERMLEVMMLNLYEGNLVRTEQCKFWVVGKVLT